MLDSIFNTTTTYESISVESLAISVVVSIILGVLIALTHKFTSEKYSKNMLITIALLPLLVEAVIIMVNGNLGTSIAIAGAFSLVRFRSLPGTSREILIVFFAMAVGLATGMGQIWFAVLLTVIGCLAMFAYNKLKIFNPKGNEKILRVLIPESLDYEDVFADAFEEYTKTAVLEEVKTTNMGSMFELTYRVALKNDAAEKEFIDIIRERNSNLKVTLSRAIQGDL